MRFHKASGQNYVVLNGKAIYCGRPDDPATGPRQHQAIGEWLAAGRQLPADPTTLTVKELLARFWTHAEQYHRTLTDDRIKELEQYRLALRPLTASRAPRCCPSPFFAPPSRKYNPLSPATFVSSVSSPVADGGFWLKKLARAPCRECLQKPRRTHHEDKSSRTSAGRTMSRQRQPRQPRLPYWRGLPSLDAMCSFIAASIAAMKLSTSSFFMAS